MKKLTGITFLGKRPKDLIQEYGDDALTKVEHHLEKILLENKNIQVFTSLSYGIEFIVGKLCNRHNIPYHVFLTFNDQEKIWPKSSQEEYQNLLLSAKSVNQVENGEWSLDKLKKKDSILIEQSDIVYYLLDKLYFKKDNNKKYIKIELNTATKDTASNEENEEILF
jgi:uncharacterized phage-like protein YoqJ